MNSTPTYACLICYTTYPTRDEAVDCSINACESIGLKYECADCENLWDTEAEANWCCSEEDTLEARAQYDNTIFGDIIAVEAETDGFE